MKPLKVGDEVRITSGNFAGLQGKIASRSGDGRVVIDIDVPAMSVDAFFLRFQFKTHDPRLGAWLARLDAK